MSDDTATPAERPVGYPHRHASNSSCFPACPGYAPVDATAGGAATPRSALSFALVGERPYDQAAAALERLALIGWTVARVAPVDATLTDDEREALFTRPRELDVRRDTEALEGIVERIVARRVSVDRAKVDCRHTELPDTLWPRLRTAEAKLEAALALADEWEDNDVPWESGRDEARRLRAVLLGAPTAVEDPS